MAWGVGKSVFRVVMLVLMGVWVLLVNVSWADQFSTPAVPAQKTLPVLNGDKTPLSPRIIGGTNAALGAFPWMVSLEYFGQPICGATLVDTRIIVTAAHCVINDPTPRRYSVRVGALNLDDTNSGVVRGVERIVANPNYNPITVDSDIAVLELDENVDTLPVRVATPDERAQLIDGTRFTVIGWGVTDEQLNVTPSRLQQANVPFVATPQCEDIVLGATSSEGITDNMLCAGGEFGVDSCFGDSGGPLLLNVNDEFIQYGIVSFGFGGCADGTFPGVYTNVANFRDFITQVSLGELINVDFGEIGQGRFDTAEVTLSNETQSDMFVGIPDVDDDQLRVLSNACTAATLLPQEDCTIELELFGLLPGDLSVMIDVPVLNDQTDNIQVQVNATVLDAIAFDTLLAASPPLFTGGDAQWQVDNTPFDTNAFGNGQALRSGLIEDNQQTSLIAIMEGPFTLSFRVRSSTEIFDSLTVGAVDNLGQLVQFQRIRGDVECETVTIQSTSVGEHELFWRYTKDFSLAEGDDAVWVDSFTTSDDIDLCQPNIGLEGFDNGFVPSPDDGGSVGIALLSLLAIGLIWRNNLVSQLHQKERTLH